MSVGVPPFQAFLDAQREDVYRLLVALVGPQDAEDCFQETFLAALRAYPRLRAGTDLRAWVLTIAYRKAMDEHRSRRRRPTPAEPPDTASWDRHEPALWDAVRRLPPKQRAALVYRYVGDLPYRKIGGAMGTTEEAARQNVRQGLRTLRETW